MLAGLFLAAGLVLSSMVATTAWLKIKNSQFVTVKGSARKNVESDLVIWRGSFTVEAPLLLGAQQQLKSDQAKVDQFLRERGVTNVVFAPITIVEVKATENMGGVTRQKTAGYRLTQTVRIESADLGRIQRLDRESAALVEEGVVFTTEPPDFIYTKAGDAKVEMLAEATKDARARAEQIAAQGNRTIAALHSAEMGVFQITPRYGVQTSWEGMNDTSSRDKTITAVVTATFLLK